MNETNKDKEWELAAAELHSGLSGSDNGNLNELIASERKDDIRKQVADLHDQLIEAAPLHNSSITASWDKIARYIRSNKIRHFLILSKYAAIILLAFAAGTFTNSQLRFGMGGNPSYTEIVAPPGQMTEISLYDGSLVWLNSGTILKYAQNFGYQNRNVEIIGEAFFKVTPSSSLFRVKMKNHEVEVHGTTFAVEAYPDEDFCQVTLVEGMVRINDRNGKYLKHLEPNQQIHIPDESSEKIVTREVSTLFYESWIKGHIKFDEERLVDVARRMERWYNVEIEFNGKEVGEIRFTGTVLKNKPADQTFQAISMLLPIKVHYKRNLDTKDIITISKK